MLSGTRIILLVALIAVFCCSCRDHRKTPAAMVTEEPEAVNAGEPGEMQASSWKVVDEAVLTGVPAPIEVVGGLEYAAGDIWENCGHNFAIVLRNRSDEPLYVTEVVASCSCTVTQSIPNGITIPARGEWKTSVNLLAEKLGFGEFKRDIAFSIHKYAPVRLTFTGNVRQAFAITPGKEMSFNPIRDAAAPWELTARVAAVPEIAEPLVLAEEIQDPFLAVQVSRPVDDEAGYLLRFTAKASLPYGKFKHIVKVPVISPSYLSHVQFTINGNVATRVQFQPKTALLTAQSFAEKQTATVVVQCGFDNPAEMAAAPAQGRLQRIQREKSVRFVDDIIWPPLFDALQVELPPGVTANKELLRYGIRITLTVDRQAFADKRKLEVKFHRDHHYLPPVTLTYSDKTKHADPTTAPDAEEEP